MGNQQDQAGLWVLPRAEPSQFYVQEDIGSSCFWKTMYTNNQLSKKIEVFRPCFWHVGSFRFPSIHRRGFTFVELLVVVAIIAVLAGLLTMWAFGARNSWRKHATHAAMANLMLAVEAVKNASPIYPDHRLANYFFIQPHTAAVNTPPVWNGGSYRRMGSGEYIAFLASLVPKADAMINSLAPNFIKPSPVSWGAWSGAGQTWPDAGGYALVDVFEQDPARTDPLRKNLLNPDDYTDTTDPTTVAPTAATVALVSPVGGYRLRMPVDSWGNPLVYRLSTDAGSLNQSDTGKATAYDVNDKPNGYYKIRENIIQDEQFTRDRYIAMGVAGVSPATATSTTVEYVRPAVAAYPNPQWISAGPDMLWGVPSSTPPGGFIDGTPATGGSSPTNATYARDAQADPKAARDPNAQDNIYSQEMNR